jgi:iron complex outermembrane recepter protein
MGANQHVVRRISAVVSILVIGLPFAAFAADDTELQEVIITAERRATDQQTTAISMTAVSGDQLADAQVNAIVDLQKMAPSFSINSTGLFNSLNIRGIGNSAVNPSITPGIAVFRDGMFQAETIMLGAPFYDIADSELLRGPQGTFVGMSSTGGALLINSKSPTFDAMNGYIEAQVGDYHEQRLQGALNLPISDTFAARIAFNTEQRNSFSKDIGSTQTPGVSEPQIDPGHVNDRNVRLGLLWKPSEAFQALLKIEHSTNDQGGTVEQPNQSTYFDPGTGTFVHSPFYAYSTHQPYVLNYDRLDRQSNEVNTRYTLEMKWKFDSGITLRSLTGRQTDNIHQIADGDATSVNGQYNRHVIGPNNSYTSQEFNLLSPEGDRLSWILGTSWFYRDTPVELTQWTQAPPAFTTNVQVLDVFIGAVQRVAGAFGQIKYKLTDTLELEAGARGNWDNNFNYGGVRVTIPVAPPFPLVINVSNAGNYKDSVPTAKVGLNWQPVPGQFFYAFGARGYKSGGINGPGDNFKAEHVNDYEVGWKSKLLDGHLQTQIGGFYTDYQGMQQPVTTIATGRNGVSNLGDSKIKGIEASIQGKFGGFAFDGGLSYLSSALGAITTAASYAVPPSASNLGQCTSASAYAAGGCFDYQGTYSGKSYMLNLSGQSNPNSPKLTYNLGVEYGFDFAGGSLTPRVTYAHTDKQYASIFQNDNYYLLDARNLWGATVSYERSNWLVQAYGINLSNSVYVAGTNGQNVYYGAPRQIGLRVNHKF